MKKQIHQCSSCGIRWEHGINATHSCSENLKNRLAVIVELLSIPEPDLIKINELANIESPFGEIGHVD